MRSFTWKVVLAGLLCAGLACDDEPQVPPELVEQARKNEDEGAKKPTTQELLQGPRGVIPLGPLPLTVRAPRDWNVQSVGTSSIIVLQGPTPSGEAQIALSRRPSTPPDRVEAVINGAKKEMATTQSSVKMAEARPLGASGARVFERQAVGRTIPAQPLDPEGKIMSKPTATLSWTITVFVPAGDVVDAYELNFVGLTVDQYETDKELLRQIIDSLALAGTAAPPPPPA